MSDLETVVRTEALSKVYGRTRALDGLDLTVPAGAGAGLARPQRRGQAGEQTVGYLARLRGMEHDTSIGELAKASMST